MAAEIGRGSGCGGSVGEVGAGVTTSVSEIGGTKCRVINPVEVQNV